MGLDDYSNRVVTPHESALKKIRKELDEIKRQPDEFTIKEVAADLGIGYKVAEYKLKKLEREGAITSRRTGKHRYFRWVEED